MLSAIYSPNLDTIPPPKDTLHLPEKSWVTFFAEVLTRSLSREE